MLEQFYQSFFFLLSLHGTPFKVYCCAKGAIKTFNALRSYLFAKKTTNLHLYGLYCKSSFKCIVTVIFFLAPLLQSQLWCNMHVFIFNHILFMTYLLHPSKVLKVLSMNRLRTGKTKVWVCAAFLGLESRLVAEWVHNSCI